MSGRKDMLKLVSLAVGAGCEAELGGSHWRLVCPNGSRVIVSASPSDHRAVMNARRDLRRCGVELGR